MKVGRRQEGQAVIETVLLGLLLIVPLIWALGVLGDLQRGALAATAAAREAGTDAARSTDRTEAGRAVEEAVLRAFTDQGLDPSSVRFDWNGPAAMDRGGTIEVMVTYPVTVLQAPLIGRVSGPSMWVRARHVTRIDPYRSRG